ncbi:hypothetical protein AMD26_015350 [Deinococcus sp. UR1]|nr:hypothetical protein AMD26_015350 [Deinococcus sp. UR1]
MPFEAALDAAMSALPRRDALELEAAVMDAAQTVSALGFIPAARLAVLREWCKAFPQLWRDFSGWLAAAVGSLAVAL